MRMNPAPAPGTHSRRRVSYGAVGAVLLSGLAGFVTFTGPALTGARPVSAVPASSSPAPQSVELAPQLIQGRVLDAESGAPLRGVAIRAGAAEAVSDAEGRFSLQLASGQSAVANLRLPGYERKQLSFASAEPTIRLRPHAIRAAYLTYYGVADRGIRDRVLELVKRTELNAVVIDVKGDRGLIPYRTEVPAALEAGALGPVIIKDFDAQIAALKAQGIYTIARIVVFKDNVLANHRRDLAIVDTRTGRPWVDNEKLAWVDPFREEVWDYAIAVAKEAAAKGFDEIQFDYVRFPTDGKLSAAKYSQPNNSGTRLPAIGRFLAKARRELAPLGVFVAADVFGYTAFNENDTDIGQRVEELVTHLDYICPMVYPSGYHRGIPGVRNPVAQPYEIVKESVRLTRKRAAHAPAVRPWLQDFRDYAFDRRIFCVPEIKAQLRGAKDGGAVGYMLWNPKNDYTGAALPSKATATARVTP